MNSFKSERQLQVIKENMDLCRMIVLVGETKRGEDQELTQ